jgi:hypothetical protein
VITASVEVKITLGPRVVYVMELWAANIGESIDVLLGMNFMYSAGVRLCAREGLVQLPDEETVLISGRSGNHAHRGLDLPVCPANSVCLQPGGQTVIRIEYGQSNPQREVVWAGRGDHWVTQIIYAAKSWPVAVKVVNVSDKTVWIDPGLQSPGLSSLDVFQVLVVLFAPDLRDTRSGRHSYTNIPIRIRPDCVRSGKTRC